MMQLARGIPPQARLVHPGWTAKPRVFFCAVTAYALAMDRALDLGRREVQFETRARVKMFRGHKRLAVRTVYHRTAVCLLVPWMVGCSQKVIQPQISFAPTERIYSDHDWTLVLQKHVHSGLVDYDGLAADREALDRYYALLGITGPDSTPEQFTTPTEKTAYYINAYNALVLIAVLQSYPVSTVYDLALPSLEHEYKFTVDGRRTTLAQLEQQILTGSNRDVRTLFTLCAAAAATPRLRGEPYRAGNLDDELDRAAKREMDNPQICQVKQASRTIFVWQKILEHSDDFVAYWQERRRTQTAYLFNVLMDLSSAERRQELQVAAGFAFAAIPFDRSLNRWSSEAATSKAGD